MLLVFYVYMLTFLPICRWMLPRPPAGYVNPDPPSFTSADLFKNLESRAETCMRALKSAIDNVLAANQGRIPPPSALSRLSELTAHRRTSDIVSRYECFGDRTVNLIASEVLLRHYDLSQADQTVSFSRRRSHQATTLTL